MSKTILFQGDSITDCGRNVDGFSGMGFGYPRLIEASLGADFPNEYEFINRGISGNRIVDLYARIKEDFIKLKPDYASIYIGANDIWHELHYQTGVNTAKFEQIYTMLIEEIKEALPDIKLILIAPYFLPGPDTCDTEERPGRWTLLRAGVAEKTAVAKKLAEKYGLAFIELQPAFDAACEKADPSYWTRDGLHPSAKGHEIIKRLWLDAFETIK